MQRFLSEIFAFSLKKIKKFISLQKNVHPVNTGLQFVFLYDTITLILEQQYNISTNRCWLREYIWHLFQRGGACCKPLKRKMESCSRAAGLSPEERKSLPSSRVKGPRAGLRAHEGGTTGSYVLVLYGWGRFLVFILRRNTDMRELLELLEHDARRPADELAAMLHRSEYEVQQQINQLEK